MQHENGRRVDTSVLEAYLGTYQEPSDFRPLSSPARSAPSAPCLSSFMPAASAMVSIRAAKSLANTLPGRPGVSRHRNAPVAFPALPPSPASARRFRAPARGRDRGPCAAVPGEGGRPVEIYQRRRFIGCEHRAHDAVVEESQKGVTRHPQLVGEEGDLDQVLDHDAEHDVVGDLADARQFALAHIGDATRREHFHHRLDRVERDLSDRRRPRTAYRP